VSHVDQECRARFYVAPNRRRYRHGSNCWYPISKGTTGDHSLHICNLYALCIPLFEEVVASSERGEEIEAESRDLSKRRHHRPPSDDEIERFTS
jgi:hypothetical protein